MNENDNSGLSNSFSNVNDLKEIKESESDNNINKGNQNQILINKSGDPEILANKSVIKKIKESEQLRVDELKNIIEKHLGAKDEASNANIIDEDFLRLVWSFNSGYYKNKNKKDVSIAYVLTNKNQLNSLVWQYPDEFFRCLYKLDIKFDDLCIIAQEAIRNSDHRKDLSDKYPEQYNITHKPWRDSIAGKMFYDSKKTLDAKFFVWLNENGYFVKHDQIVFYRPSGHNIKAISENLSAIDEFESICKKRKEQRIGNYKFETFDEFKKFVGFDKDDEQYEKKYYPKVAVSVESLSEILKKENKYLTKDEFIKLVNRENIFFNKLENLTEADIKDMGLGGHIEEWDDYKGFVNQSGIDIDNGKRRKARKKFWGYMKHILFGNPKKQDTQGLIDARNLNDDDLKNIANCLSEKFEFFTGITLLYDEEDVFDKNKNKSNGKYKYKNYILDSLKQFKNLFLTCQEFGCEQNIGIKLKQGKNMTESNENESATSQNVTNNWKRLTAGIILLVFGVIGCGSIALGLGLTSKLAFVLLFLFVFMIITGTAFLFWKKISGCLALCCPRTSESMYQNSLIEKGKIAEQGKNLMLNIDNNDQVKNEDKEC